MASLLPLMAIFGGLLGGFLIEILGRKWTCLLTDILFITVWALIGVAGNVWWLYAARFTAGFAVSITNLVLPVFIAETVHQEVRGALGLFPTFFGNGGIVICFIVGRFMTWRPLAWFGFFLSVPFPLLWFFLPESPRWLLSKKKIEKSEKSLQWLRGKSTDIADELKELEKAQEEAQQKKTNIKDLFQKHNFKPLLISLGLMFFQQMSGINAVVFYTTPIFKMAGSTIEGSLCTIIVGVVNFISTAIATAVIDKLGRKALLYISAGTMIVNLLVLGVYFYMKDSNVDVSSYGWLPLLSLVVYVFGFSLGFGPIPWLMMGEILPTKIRGMGAAIVTAFNWLCAFIVTKTFADIIDLIGASWVFWIYGLITIVSVVFTIFLVPETKGKTLEEIEKEF